MASFESIEPWRHEPRKTIASDRSPSVPWPNSCAIGSIRCCCPASPGQQRVVESEKAPGLVRAAALNDRPHAGDTAVHIDARARFGLRPSGVQRDHDDMARLDLDRESLHDGIEARLRGP